jgi:hypothetical protein
MIDGGRGVCPEKRRWSLLSDVRPWPAWTPLWAFDNVRIVRCEENDTGTPTSAPDEHPPDSDQIVERLSWTPKQRLDYLLDMLAFEERARRGRRVC